MSPFFRAFGKIGSGRGADGDAGAADVLLEIPASEEREAKEAREIPSRNERLLVDMRWILAAGHCGSGDGGSATTIGR